MMINIGRIRLFYRGFRVPQLPYYWNQWGVIGFGISFLGVMFFKKIIRIKYEFDKEVDYEGISQN